MFLALYMAQTVLFSIVQSAEEQPPNDFARYEKPVAVIQPELEDYMATFRTKRDQLKSAIKNLTHQIELYDLEVKGLRSQIDKPGVKVSEIKAKIEIAQSAQRELQTESYAQERRLNDLQAEIQNKFKSKEVYRQIPAQFKISTNELQKVCVAPATMMYSEAFAASELNPHIVCVNPDGYIMHELENYNRDPRMHMVTSYTTHPETHKVLETKTTRNVGNKAILDSVRILGNGYMTEVFLTNNSVDRACTSFDKPIPLATWQRDSKNTARYNANTQDNQVHQVCEKIMAKSAPTYAQWRAKYSTTFFEQKMASATTR